MKVILASQSPRRKALLTEAGLDITVVPSEVDESFPAEMPVQSVPLYLSYNKCVAVRNAVSDMQPIIAADTIVVVDNNILNKPTDRADAIGMLQQLRGRSHQVITGCCIAYDGAFHQFSSTTNVYFKALEDAQIAYYVDQYAPYDKAGGYAIQEWIGMIGVA